MEAKRIGFYEFQLNLLEDAAELERGDPRVWCQLGDSLLTRDRPLKALEAFRQAEALGDERGGMIGRAEVAKATNDLPQALQLYDKVIEAFPDDPVPQNARAEVLKLSNCLDDALAAYDRIIKGFPFDSVPKSGRAEVLKRLGRLDDALEQYDAAIEANLRELGYGE